jgi:hypothetical protein
VKVVNFEVNGVTYFLGFNDEIGKWQVLTASRKGLRRINVVDDEALPFFGTQVWEESDNEGPERTH